MSILLPLILSSIERIEKISTAMELRGFGSGRKRTWYTGRPFSRSDYIAMGLLVALAAATLIVTFYDGSRFYSIF